MMRGLIASHSATDFDSIHHRRTRSIVWDQSMRGSLLFLLHECSAIPCIDLGLSGRPPHAIRVDQPFSAEPVLPGCRDSAGLKAISRIRRQSLATGISLACGKVSYLSRCGL